MLHRAGQQHIDPAMKRLGERVRTLGGDHPEQPAGRTIARLGAERHRAAGQVGAHAARAAYHLHFLDPLAREQLLHERAAQALLGLVAGLHHGDLRQRRDRRHVQVLARVRRPGTKLQNRAQLASARCDRHLGHHARRALRPAAAEASRDVALVRRPALHCLSGARHDHGHGGPDVVGGYLRDALETLAREHCAHHLQVRSPRRRKRCRNGHCSRR